MIAGVVGWGTNVVAVQMLFHPVEFVGIRPYMGWQGIIPNAAHRMGRYIAILIATRLVNVKELLASLDASSLIPSARPALWELADSILDAAVRDFAAPLWNGLDEKARTQVRNAVRAEVEKLAAAALDDLKDEAHEVIDIAAAIEQAILKDRSILNRLFLTAGSREFRFIRISGLYFGFLFGLLQMAVWVIFPKWWTLPLAGVLVGYVTNWLAMKMIFEPKTPKKFGPFEFHGLFHKRQNEVAAGFSTTVSATMLTPVNVVGQLSSGRGRETIQGIFQRRVGEAMDTYGKHPVGGVMLQQAGRSRISSIIERQMEVRLTQEGGILWSFVEKTLNVADSMTEKLRGLEPEAFEGVLRPAFQQDEWKLILVGAVLGGIAGWLQAVYVFGHALG